MDGGIAKKSIAAHLEKKHVHFVIIIKKAVSQLEGIKTIYDVVMEV